MLYVIVRVVIFLMVASGVLLLARRRMVIKKSLIIAVALASVLVAILCIWSFENAFLRFESPEDAFRYSRIGEIVDIVHGENSCMIVYNNASKNSIAFYQLTKHGYKLTNVFTTHNVLSAAGRQGTINVYYIRGSDDYYVFGLATSTSMDIRITDSCGQEINHRLLKTENLRMKTIIFYDFFSKYEDEYNIIIDGKKMLEE